LVLKKNKELFIEWLKNKSGVTAQQAETCHQSLSEWSDQFL
jgi:hypothetical protein